MTDPTLNLDTLARRLAKVERENRRVRWAGGVAALLLVFSLFTRAMTTDLDVHTLRVRNRNGEVRATLGVHEGDGARLTLYDSNGKAREGLGFYGDDPGVLLYDANGKMRALLGVPKDEPILALYDASEKGIWSAP